MMENAYCYEKMLIRNTRILAVINLRQRTCETYKMSSLLLIGFFFSYTRVRD
jgi:hypothetical protein